MAVLVKSEGSRYPLPQQLRGFSTTAIEESLGSGSFFSTQTPIRRSSANSVDLSTHFIAVLSLSYKGYGDIL